jgi:CHAT domain-containing protein
LSLARPLLAAGVPSVVSSLWDIDDSVGQRFFVTFHRFLLRSGEPLLALRDAQLSFLRGGDPLLGHPTSWAAFVCLGGLNQQKAAAFLANGPSLATL